MRCAYLLVILLPKIISINQLCPCPSNSYCSNTYCICQPGFIINCDIHASVLTLNKPYPTTVTSTPKYYSYAPSNPNNFLQLIIVFCLAQTIPNTSISFSLWLDNGNSISLSSSTSFFSQYLPAISNCYQCKIDYERYPLQPNGEIQQLIVGLYLTTPSSQSITLTIQQNTTNTNVLTTVSYILISILSLITLTTFIICICQKCRNTRNNQPKNTINNIEHFQIYLPKKTLKQLQLPTGTICSVCLCEWTSQDLIRKTPCKHFFHAQCLDSWCLKNLTCPFCRTQLSSKIIEELIKNKPINIEMSWQQNPSFREEMLE